MEWAGHRDGPHDLVEVIGSYRLADIPGALVFQLFEFLEVPTTTSPAFDLTGSGFLSPSVPRCEGFCMR